MRKIKILKLQRGGDITAMSENINEFILTFGSDGLGKSGYDVVTNFENLGEHND